MKRNCENYYDIIMSPLKGRLNMIITNKILIKKYERIIREGIDNMNNLNIISKIKENENIEKVFRLIKSEYVKRNKRKNAKLVRGYNNKIPIDDVGRY